MHCSWGGVVVVVVVEGWGDKHLVISSKQGLRFIRIHREKKSLDKLQGRKEKL